MPSSSTRNRARALQGLCVLLFLAMVAGACGSDVETTTASTAASSGVASSSSDSDEASAEVPTIAVTTGIWADVASNVACGDSVSIEVIIPDGADPHGFEPSLADRARMDAASLLITNGLDLEEGLLDTIEATEAQGTPVLRLGDHVEPIIYGSAAREDDPAEAAHSDEDHDEHGDADHDDHGDEDHDDHGDEDHDEHGDEDHDEHGDEHADEDHDEHGDEEHGDEEHGDEDHADEHGDEDHDEHGDEDHDEHADEHGGEDGHGHGHAHADGSLDPHIWFDPQRVITAIDHIADALVDEAGLDRSAVDGCVATYVAELEELDQSVQDRVAALDAGERLLVTNHDALGYFATRYDFEIVGTVLPTPSGLAAANPRDLESLAFIVEKLKVPAIFAEAQHSTSDAEAVADRVGDVQVVTLQTGSLGESGTGADTYVGLIESTADKIVEALG